MVRAIFRLGTFTERIASASVSTATGRSKLARHASATLRDGTGVVSDSSGGFILPNGAVRSPDVAWILRSRVEQIPAQQRTRFLPACPDFVLELRSPADRLSTLQAKLREYIANGARLGWLIDPDTKKVHVYRPDRPVEILDNPQTLSGDPELPGFVLDLVPVWQP